MCTLSAALFKNSLFIYTFSPPPPPPFLWCGSEAFRCAYCYFLNPARKMRPQAPRLPEPSAEKRMSADPAANAPAAPIAEPDSPLPAATGTPPGSGRGRGRGIRGIGRGSPRDVIYDEL